MIFVFYFCSCPFFRNEIGGEAERIVGLTRSRGRRNSAPLHRPTLACGVSVLEYPPGSSHWPPDGACPYATGPRAIETVDNGALYYRQYFYGQGNQFALILNVIQFILKKLFSFKFCNPCRIPIFSTLSLKLCLLAPSSSVRPLISSLKSSIHCFQDPPCLCLFSGLYFHVLQTMHIIYSHDLPVIHQSSFTDVIQCLDSYSISYLFIKFVFITAHNSDPDNLVSMRKEKRFFVP